MRTWTRWVGARPRGAPSGQDHVEGSVGADVRADLDATYETNVLVRAISGSSASVIFTVQSD